MDDPIQQNSVSFELPLIFCFHYRSRPFAVQPRARQRFLVDPHPKKLGIERERLVTRLRRRPSSAHEEGHISSGTYSYQTPESAKEQLTLNLHRVSASLEVTGNASFRRSGWALSLLIRQGSYVGSRGRMIAERPVGYPVTFDSEACVLLT